MLLDFAIDFHKSIGNHFGDQYVGDCNCPIPNLILNPMKLNPHSLARCLVFAEVWVNNVRLVVAIEG